MARVHLRLIQPVPDAGLGQVKVSRDLPARQALNIEGVVLGAAAI